MLFLILLFSSYMKMNNIHINFSLATYFSQFMPQALAESGSFYSVDLQIWSTLFLTFIRLKQHWKSAWSSEILHREPFLPFQQQLKRIKYCICAADGKIHNAEFAVEKRRITQTRCVQLWNPIISITEVFMKQDNWTSWLTLSWNQWQRVTMLSIGAYLLAHPKYIPFWSSSNSFGA